MSNNTQKLTPEEKLRFIKAWVWNPDEPSNDQFERIGEMFCKQTGYLRPGKSYPIDCFVPEDRDQVFKDWCDVQSRLCHEMLASLIEREVE